MSFINMWSRLVGEMPGLPIGLAQINVQEALSLIYDEIQWSFQLQESNWLTPGLQFPTGPGTSAGTITVSPGSNLITGDAAASAAWVAYVAPPFFTQLQIRSPYYSLYNIINLDVTTPTAAVITIDRPWGEPAQMNGAYMIYQAYYAPPVPDFRRFIAIRDTTNGYPIDYWSKSQKDLSVEDPQRTIFDDPTNVVPYEMDQRIGSATLGLPLYEMWPHPLSQLPYTYNYIRQGPPLVNATDMAPYPLNEETIVWRAKEVSYLSPVVQKEMQTKGYKPDWRFLAQSAHAEYERRLKTVKDIDRNMIELYWNKYWGDVVPSSEGFATITGQVNVGRW